ncbi:unnamed protein product [Rotaria sp. Silwood1]|nr:unnamed protein product [Rotaria sp. Silwood1]CAF1058074.1 unnamed protein product [Rotaria sp. Silwood1]CAF3473347.1 unnamed protein product [Rotaria sp. Silwood1]CAF4576375.1 unnamed protein product [Rotaria sp. Silwood1]
MGRRGHKKQKAFRRATVDAIRKARLEKQQANNGQSTNNKDETIQDDQPRVNKYEDIVKENALLEKYYKAMNLVPDDEWDAFLAALKEPLPVTFRVTGFRTHAFAVMNLIRDRYFQPLESSTTIDKPKELVWYPGSLAWQLNLSRSQLRSSPELQKLKEFLYEQTEHGNISRQEAVSMIPPLVLDIQPHHKILDMCAAPGSKTAQIIECLHRDESNPIPSGFVIANDVDNKRCYTLVHQVKRLESPCFAIINHDASNLPNLKFNDGNILFDRILCDVPCSGDGTLRKNPDLWKKWNPGHASSLQSIQLRIATRGIQLLAPGGLMVYSTCSMNPIENEAVVGQLLQAFEGQISLVDISDKLPGLRTKPGLKSWCVIGKNQEIYNSFEEVPKNMQSLFRPNMFPPSNDILEQLHLERCIRLLPHHQDTGAFFVALFRKIDKIVDSSLSIQEETSQKRQVEENVFNEDGANFKRARYHRENPFIFFEEKDIKGFWQEISEFFGVHPSFPADQLMTRIASDSGRNIYFVSDSLKQIVTLNQDRIKFINMGVRLLVRTDLRNDKDKRSLRLAQEGIAIINNYFSKRHIQLEQQDLLLLLSHAHTHFANLSESVRNQIQNMSDDLGSLICLYNIKQHDLDIPIIFVSWRGRNSLRPFVSHSSRKFYFALCNIDPMTINEIIDKLTIEEKATNQKKDDGS